MEAIGHRLAQLVAVASAVWVVLWLLVGGTSTGKGWYDLLAKGSFGKKAYKAGLPLLTVAFPIWISTLVAMLWGRSTLVPTAFHVQNFGCLALWGIIVPISVYTACSVYRHIREEDTLDDQWMESGNAFGYAALIALNVLLIPVTRHSTLLKLMGWNPAAAIRLHIWSGRLVVLFSWVHGFAHLYRFAYILNYASVVGTLTPPHYCWDPRNDDTIPDCDAATEDCSCYRHWRNAIGIVAGLGLLLMALSSLHTVRRSFYTLFYRIHVLAGPTVLLAVILHWDRSLLYMCGGLLYYLATTLLVVLESHLSRPALLVQVEHLPSVRPCVALTFQASESAIAQYPAGSYVKLRWDRNGRSCCGRPLSHPFTVNLVPRQPGHVRVLFRVTGDFTTQLAAEISPRLHLEGYHGPPKSFHGHDVVVLVAGGIGITPYLSLLHQHDSDLSHTRIVVHWICRDANLIAYVRREYLDTLPASALESMTLIIHATGDDDESTYQTHIQPMPPAFSSSTKNGGSSEADEAGLTAPFAPTRFAPLKPTVWVATKFLVVPFVSTVAPGTAALWYLYGHVQDAHAILPRLWTSAIVLGWTVVVALASQVLLRYDPNAVEWTPLKRSESTDDGDDDDDVGCHNNGFVQHHHEQDSDLEMVPAQRWTIDDEDDVEGDEEGNRHRLADETTAPSADAKSVASQVLAPLRRLEVRRGRPSSLTTLLRDAVAEAERPAVFCCGPSSLLTDVRHSLRRVSRSGCYGCGAPVLYEETFEL